MPDNEMTGSGMGLSQTLPEGVVRGENVPPENDEHEQVHVERVMGALKARGAPFTEMSDAELRDRARRILDESAGDSTEG